VSHVPYDDRGLQQRMFSSMLQSLTQCAGKSHLNQIRRVQTAAPYSFAQLIRDSFNHIITRTQGRFHDLYPPVDIGHFGFEIANTVNRGLVHAVHY